MTTAHHTAQATAPAAHRLPALLLSVAVTFSLLAGVSGIADHHAQAIEAADTAAFLSLPTSAPTQVVVVVGQRTPRG